MAGKRDYYEVLGVAKNATEKDIATAYRKLAMANHPDKNPGDNDAVKRFKEGAEAYEVLSDPEKRARYDRLGHAGVDGGAGGQPHFNDVSDIFEAFGNIFGDGVFGNIFGQRGRGRQVQKGSDVRADVSLDLLEAAKGCKRKIQFRRHAKCDSCEGTGAKLGTKPETCRYCNGAGQVVQQSGIFRMQTTCPACRGRGTMIKNPCPACSGEGITLERVEREVNIPAGVDNETRLRLAGEGDPSPSGGPPGDCYIFIEVREHALFQREGSHLICRLPITYPQAALGAKVQVPTLNGPGEIEVPAGTQPGDVMRLKGLGMPDPRGHGVGDLHVQFTIEIPKQLSERQAELLRELAKEDHTNVSPQRKSWLEKLRDYIFEPPEESTPA